MQQESIKGPDDFKPKIIQFNFSSKLSRFWCAGSYNRTYFFNALGILAPSFERLFILSVLNFRKALKGTDLEKPIRAFLGQEAQHDHQIRRFNQHLKQLGYPIEDLESSNLALCKKLNNRCSAKTQLAFTMGAEHLISLVSDLNLKDPIWFAGADKEVAALWRWHAIEEVEHKSVAFDVYHRVCNQYWRKILAYVVVISVIGMMWGRNWLAMAKHDKLLTKPKFWVDTLKYCFFKPGVFSKLLWPMCQYFSPWFHPWQHDNRHLVATWKDYFSKKPSHDHALSQLSQTLPRHESSTM